MGSQTNPNLPIERTDSDVHHHGRTELLPLEWVQCSDLISSLASTTKTGSRPGDRCKVQNASLIDWYMAHSRAVPDRATWFIKRSLFPSSWSISLRKRKLVVFLSSSCRLQRRSRINGILDLPAAISEMARKETRSRSIARPQVRENLRFQVPGKLI